MKNIIQNIKIPFSDQFQKDLESGSIVKDGKIPPFRSLADRYGCSAATVKRMVDALEEKGVLRTIRGSGTFLVGPENAPRRQKRHQIGAIVLEDFSKTEWEHIKDELLQKGWLCSVYHASQDQQSPEKEKQFLKLALEEDFESVILEATPIAPDNSAWFQKLRHEGTKVVHLSPYKMDMREECYFMPDFYAAGQMAVVRLALAEYGGFLFSDAVPSAPFIQQMKDGCRMMADQLNLPELPAGKRESPETMLKRLAKKRGKYAVITVSSSEADMLLASAKKLGISVPGNIGILFCMTNAENKAETSGFSYDFQSLMRAAVRCALDQKRDPFDLIQKKYPPIWNDRKTL